MKQPQNRSEPELMVQNLQQSPQSGAGKGSAVQRRYAPGQEPVQLMPHRDPIQRSAVQMRASGNGQQQYTVAPGDTLGAIARRLLGDTNLWTRIAEANGIADPTKLQIGQVLTIPGAAQGQTGGETQGQEAGQQEGQQAGSESAPEETQAQEGEAEAASVEHVVQRGDTLRAIARRYLGDANLWNRIAEANGISDPTKLRVGQILQIPSGDASAEQTPEETQDNTTGQEDAQESQTPEQTPETNGQTPESNGQTPEQSNEQTPEQSNEQTPEQGNEQTPETNGQTPEQEQTEEQPETRPEGTFTITDGRALLRRPPPDLTSTNEVVPAGTQVRITETAVKDGKEYVLVQQVLEQGEEGTPQTFGWTSKANLGGFEGGGHANEHDETLRPDDVVLLSGLSGLDRKMATIYNSKGKFLHEKAQSLGVSTAAAAAVLKVESAGNGFANDGRMIIRFENHVFNRYWGQSNPQQFAQHFQFSSGQAWKGHKWRPDASGPWQDFHGNQGKEWQVLEFARSLDNDAALKSISMGAAQIMGFNFEKEGYETVQAMFDRMSGAIRPQLVGMFTFIENTSLCINGLREGNYVKFARGYNGSGQAETYGALIQQAADAYARVTRGKNFTD